MSPPPSSAQPAYMWGPWGTCLATNAASEVHLCGLSGQHSQM
eukprot:CAMPEP_0114142060 /NCGR_PEP_ID=MMETSP0043_2-20121206/18246_1 /TAXON_ID=464988 /ORGANISM="Hemiselmis andersenii, Strain CCMP644" /LENGTH=41 /DNA_ID= /DNA_START= /DNA_END= /DNA_ORIENTATION=